MNRWVSGSVGQWVKVPAPTAQGRGGVIVPELHTRPSHRTDRSAVVCNGGVPPSTAGGAAALSRTAKRRRAQPVVPAAPPPLKRGH